MKKWMLCLAGFLALAPGAFCQDPAARQTLDRSLGWGIDRDTGKIAVDAYLLYFYDPENRVLVINGNAADQAAVDAEAKVLEDGRWLMPDGTALKPLVGEIAIFAGDEPDDLKEAMRGFPETSLSRVQLSQEVSASAERVKWFRRCNHCNACPNGCSEHWLFQGGQFRSCGSGGFFTRCKERSRTDYCNPVLEFACNGCTGSVIHTFDLTLWGCANGC